MDTRITFMSLLYSTFFFNSLFLSKLYTQQGLEPQDQELHVLPTEPARSPTLLSSFNPMLTMQMAFT